MGYITQGRGVSVHKADCEQLQHLSEEHPERLIDVNWADALNVGFETSIDIFCADRDGLLRDITTVLANENVALLGVNSLSDKSRQTATISVSIEVADLDILNRVLTRLQQQQGVVGVKRKES